ncbi:MAG: HAD hydrolase family protein [Roseburia sp.]|nr:HAD hydrolase family protein [Roseburia sp.]
MELRKKALPPIGMRIAKSAAAVFLCYLVSFLRGNSGIVFYSQLAALWCIQPYIAGSRKNAGQRFIGTVIGALYGLMYLLGRQWAPALTDMGNAVCISVLVLAVLYTTVLIKKKQASYFSCVVFLSIVVNHVRDVNPYLFVWNRFLDTVIGIAIGIGVNSFALPRRKNKDILFLSGLDDTLLHEGGSLSDYSRVELNRMLDAGMQFSIATMRTPASIHECLRDIRLRLPVIAMDGAVLYDVKENRFLKTYVISQEMSSRVYAFIREAGLSCYANVIVDDVLLIYYEEQSDSVNCRMLAELRRSPYRNYICKELPKEERVVYFMLLYPNAVIEDFYKKLEAEGFTRELKVLKYCSTEYEGYSYIKIYNRNAVKENMVGYLEALAGTEKTVTFGSIAGKYDYTICAGDSNRVVHILKRLFERVAV